MLVQSNNAHSAYMSDVGNEENQANLTSFLICSKTKELFSEIKFQVGEKNTCSAWANDSIYHRFN